MAATMVYVTFKSTGKKAPNKKVQFEFESGGMSDAKWTDDDGKAVIEHRSSGYVIVYVAGKKMGRHKSGTPAAYAI